MYSVNREDLAWAAGIHCGEGSVTALKSIKSNGKIWQGVTLKITQACYDGTEDCPEMLIRLQRIFGFGHNYKNCRARGNRRPTWTWETGRFEYVQAAIALMWNWLTPEKKNQAERRLKEALASVPANKRRRSGPKKDKI